MWVGERGGRSGSDVIGDGMISKGGICAASRSHSRSCSPARRSVERGDHSELDENRSGNVPVKNFRSA